MQAGPQQKGQAFGIVGELLTELFLQPQARGKGLGRALIEGCEAWARERGHRLLTVGVLSRNPTAIRAYEGAGYAPYVTIMRRYL